MARPDRAWLVDAGLTLLALRRAPRWSGGWDATGLAVQAAVLVAAVAVALWRLREA